MNMSGILSLFKGEVSGCVTQNPDLIGTNADWRYCWPELAHWKSRSPGFGKVPTAGMSAAAKLRTCNY